MTSTIPSLREYGEYLESLDRPLDLDALIVAEGVRARTDTATVHEVDATELAAGETAIVELDIARGAPSGRRRRLVVAAAAVTIVVLAATVLIDGARDDGIRTRVPAGPSRGVTTVPTLPASASLSPGFDALMASDPAIPSTPETGELVASAWFGGDLGVYLVYADGRMLWVDDVAGTPGWLERRLTPKGVERVRSEFLATGLFDDGLVGDEGCGAAFALLCVRDGGRLLSHRALSGPGTGAAAPGWSSEDLLLRERLRTLPWSLPPTDWADQVSKAYTPSKYLVCLVAGLPRGPGSVVPEPAKALRALPARAAKILRGRQADLPAGSMGGAGCFVVSTGRTQVLARELVDAYGAPLSAGSGDKSSFEIQARVTGNRGVGPAFRPRLKRFAIKFMQQLPNGDAAFYYRAWA